MTNPFLIIDSSSDPQGGEGIVDFIYWEWADNEETSPGVPRGFYTVKPDGTLSVAGTKLETLL